MNNAATGTSLTLTAPPARRTGVWRSALWLLLAGSVLLLVAAFAWIGPFDATPLHLTVNGTPLVTDLSFAALPQQVVLAVLVAAVLLVALLAALAGVVVALLALVPIVLLVVALPVLLGGVVLLLALSPLLLLAWLLWRAVRPAQRSTTMPA